MHNTAQLETSQLGSVDDFLGNREGRFFGEGFKRVSQDLTDVTVRPAAAQREGRIEATVRIGFPEAWSRKGDTDQRPHLSTIDAMLIAAGLTGLYTAHAHGLRSTGHFRVRSLRIKAGTEPDEEKLERLPVLGTLYSSTDLPTPGRGLTVMDCRIGAMTVRITAEHDTDPRAAVTAEGFYQRPEELDGPWNSRPYGASHRGRRQLLGAVRSSPADRTASAELDISTDPADPQSATLPMTMIDLFVSALQLGQILLYELDGVDRASSNTLWMRGTTIDAVPVPADEPADGRFRTVLDNPVRLATPQGTWRSARIVATHAGMRLTCKVAHLLP
ncbi:avirulence D protein (AvrD) [Streptomyces sp. 846.5]|nr:AvrD family protein [Streptomyces sp. 846.5]TDU04080.1 avirulence D protein (AvrD) [Streptomyces sp. 846.5]